jgi:MinD-like ATPase involved in chromosome partitioning or flagellar assembly
MDFPKIVSIYSRTPSVGKKTLGLNIFLEYAKKNPGTRILIVDFSLTEKLGYSLLKYGTSNFGSNEFISEISDDILVNESLAIHNDTNEGSFLRVLPSSGCQISEKDLKAKIQHRVNSLFFKDIIDLLVFILPTSLEENSITMAALLESEMVLFISTDKFPSINLTKSSIQNFFNFLTVPTLLIVNMIQPPILLRKVDSYLKNLEKQIRGTIFYSIPWTQELHEFADKGIFSLEHPFSKVDGIFQDFVENLKNAIETRNLEIKPSESIALPQALFMTDRYSGETMYYYFFGTAEDEMKNPELITAALSSIAHMISETAGRSGDLRGIDNGNSYIDFQYGKRVIGILYSSKEDETLSKLLLNFTNRFEKEFKDALVDFSKSGRIGGFSGGKNLLTSVFEDFIFDIKTVSSDLRQRILNFQARYELTKIDPEEAFQSYVNENIFDQIVRDLLYLEFTTSHNARHDFLLQLDINPRSSQKKIEEETGRLICACTEPSKYIQIQGFDALGLLDLPEELRPTARALFTSKILSAESAAKITLRSQSTELKVLEELRKLGYVRKVSPDG